LKYIVLSFDDGRKDFYVNALPILKKYGLTATLNVIPDMVAQIEENKLNQQYRNFMTWNNIKEVYECGIEIANHSADHTNNIQEIIRGNRIIREKLNLSFPIGFSSPKSEIFKGNFAEYESLLTKEGISYIRSGTKTKRDGYFHAFLYMLYKYTKSPSIYSFCNKRNIIDLRKSNKELKILPSVTCSYDNTLKQMVRFICKIPDESAAILMFHSIFKETNVGYGKEKWVTDEKDFDKLCHILSANEGIKVITNAELVSMIK